MLGLLLILPGLLSAAPASLTKHVVKAPSPIYTAPVYNEHTGQGINHGYGQGLGFGLGQGAAYGQGYANGAHVTPIKPGHVFTGYPAYTQGHHTGHQAGHQVGHHVGHQVGHHVGHQAGHHVGQYTGSHQHYPAGGQYQRSLPTRPPSTSTLASPASDSRLQTPRTEKLLLRATIALYGNRHLWKSNKR